VQNRQAIIASLVTGNLRLPQTVILNVRIDQPLISREGAIVNQQFFVAGRLFVRQESRDTIKLCFKAIEFLYFAVDHLLSPGPTV